MTTEKARQAADWHDAQADRKRALAADLAATVPTLPAAEGAPLALRCFNLLAAARDHGKASRHYAHLLRDAALGLTEITDKHASTPSSRPSSLGFPGSCPTS